MREKLFMFKRIIAAIFILIIAGSCQTGQLNLDHPVYDIDRGRQTNLSQMTGDLKKNRIVLVGEHHSNRSHHRAQLAVIQALAQAGAKVAIGLEMFREDSQGKLDQWISGELDEADFERIYYDNWNFPYDAYRMIFEYARDNQIPMIGLNVSRDITRQVSRAGFQSLSEEAKGKLSEVACRVDEAYMNYIRKAFGAHAHGNLNFIYFCEAQLVWDNIMAINILNYLKQNPDAVVVALTGTGHAQKLAVPRQISSRSQLPYKVILPEVPGRIDAQTMTLKEADYIILEP
jgi:uncharacterized iron-regulated protein